MDARETESRLSPLASIGLGLLGLAYAVVFLMLLVKAFARFSMGQQNNHWLGTMVLLILPWAVLGRGVNWLRRVAYVSIGLWAALMVSFPLMRMPPSGRQLLGLLFCIGMGFWAAGWHRDRCIRSDSAPGIPWEKVRESLALGGWAATAVLGVVAAGAAYAAVCVLVVKAVQGPAAAAAVPVAIAVVALLGFMVSRTVRAVRGAGSK